MRKPQPQTKEDNMQPPSTKKPKPTIVPTEEPHQLHPHQQKTNSSTQGLVAQWSELVLINMAVCSIHA